MNMHHYINKLLHSISVLRPPKTIKKNKIKLVAIAKNEAAYLPEWIFHHLQFGFNHIEVHINATTDNTNELIKKLAPLTGVKFVDANEKFATPQIKFPQMHIYQEALTEGEKDNFTHLMFLDIDEFWLPVDFRSTIYDCVNELKGDVISFEWFMKYVESIPFGPVIPTRLVGKKSPQLKSIVKTGIQITFASPHNMVVENGTNMLADGSIFKPTKENFSVAPDIDELASVKKYFVLHRMFRSQTEYVAMLGRTNPFKRKGFNSIFKDNRFGYDANEEASEIIFPRGKVDTYNHDYQAFKKLYDIDSTIEEAQSFVLARKKQVIKQIECAPLNEEKTLKKILRKVTDPETVSAWGQFKSRHKQSLKA